MVGERPEITILFNSDCVDKEWVLEFYGCVNGVSSNAYDNLVKLLKDQSSLDLLVGLVCQAVKSLSYLGETDQVFRRVAAIIREALAAEELRQAINRLIEAMNPELYKLTAKDLVDTIAANKISGPPLSVSFDIRVLLVDCVTSEPNFGPRLISRIPSHQRLPCLQEMLVKGVKLDRISEFVAGPLLAIIVSSQLITAVEEQDFAKFTTIITNLYMQFKSSKRLVHSKLSGLSVAKWTELLKMGGADVLKTIDEDAVDFVNKCICQRLLRESGGAILIDEINDEGVREYCRSLKLPKIYTEGLTYSDSFFYQLERTGRHSVYQVVSVIYKASQTFVRMPVGWTCDHLHALLRNIIRPAFRLDCDLGHRSTCQVTQATEIFD
jgi:Trp operon repressor